MLKYELQSARIRLARDYLLSNLVEIVHDLW